MPEERLPPHNLEAEEAVLGSLLLDPTCIVQIADFLRVGDFYREKNNWVYDASVANRLVRLRKDALEKTAQTIKEAFERFEIAE